MYLCYFDESGDAGVPSASLNPPTTWFVLNGLVIDDADWLGVLDALVTLRKQLRDNYGLPPRDELKGVHFRSGKGIFRGRGIARPKRMKIYRSIMNFQSTLPVTTFSVAVAKQAAAAKGWDPRFCAWTFALQRLDTICRKGDDRCIIFPDEGHGFFIRQRIRAMRRYHYIPKHYGPGSFQLPTSRVIEDPNDRKSQDSYFVQLADLTAYASHRSAYIHPVRKMATDVWDNLHTASGDARLLAVNKQRGGPPGIVKYP